MNALRLIKENFLLCTKKWRKWWRRTSWRKKRRKTEAKRKSEEDVVFWMMYCVEWQNTLWIVQFRESHLISRNAPLFDCTMSCICHIELVNGEQERTRDRIVCVVTFNNIRHFIAGAVACWCCSYHFATQYTHRIQCAIVHITCTGIFNSNKTNIQVSNQTQTGMKELKSEIGRI